jgi:probable rRNA maturation factor
MTSFTIDFIFNETNWNQLDNNLEAIAKRASKQVLLLATMPDLINETPIHYSIKFSNAKEVKELNKTYRNKDKPTNVLSFSNLETDMPIVKDLPINLGDIILSFETVKEEALEQNKSFLDHTTHLIVHGILHLLGYDHEIEEEAREMEQLETDILRALNVENPYKEY